MDPKVMNLLDSLKKTKAALRAVMHNNSVPGDFPISLGHSAPAPGIYKLDDVLSEADAAVKAVEG